MNATELLRIEMTCRCRDSDVIDRVSNAGALETFRGRTVQIMHNGVRVVAGGYHGDWTVEVIRRLRGCHEPQEEAVFWRVTKGLGEAPVMVELGAFWAYYSCWFLKANPAGRVYCVEPDPNNLALGETNLQLNDMKGVFINAAVGAASSEMRFASESDGVVRPTPVVSVDSLTGEYAIPRIDVLLSDIQGGETAMLDGCQKTIRAGKLRFLFLSTHHHSISGDPLTHQKCLARIRDLGGHVFAEHTVSESFSGDGLIAASFATVDRDLPEVPLTRNRASTNIWREPEYDLADALAREAEHESFRGALRQTVRAGRRAVARRINGLLSRPSPTRA
jgi:FkbM family methyltransferase